MAARTADPSLDLPFRLTSPANREIHAVPNPQTSSQHETLGAFGGLAFAILFQFLAGFAVYGGWVLLRHLR